MHFWMKKLTVYFCLFSRTSTDMVDSHEEDLYERRRPFSNYCYNNPSLSPSHSFHDTCSAFPVSDFFYLQHFTHNFVFQL